MVLKIILFAQNFKKCPACKSYHFNRTHFTKVKKDFTAPDFIIFLQSLFLYLHLIGSNMLTKWGVTCLRVTALQPISWVCGCHLSVRPAKYKLIHTGKDKSCKHWIQEQESVCAPGIHPAVGKGKSGWKVTQGGYWGWGDKFWIESWVWCPDCWGVYCMRVCVCVRMHDRAASAAECIALPRSSEGTVMHGLRVVMNKTVSLVFLLDWPLLMAPGCSSSVLMWKAARHSTA